LNSLNVGGTNCVLKATTLNIAGIAAGTLEPISPATESSLVLTQASILQIGGVLTLKDHAQIAGGGLPQSKLVIQQNAFLVSTNTAEVHGAATGNLIVDNSGTVAVQAGSLTFSGGIAWKSSAGVEEFRASGPGSTVLFNSPFQLDNSVKAFLPVTARTAGRPEPPSTELHKSVFSIQTRSLPGRATCRSSTRLRVPALCI
jgi:hypothetical protein